MLFLSYILYLRLLGIFCLSFEMTMFFFIRCTGATLINEIIFDWALKKAPSSERDGFWRSLHFIHFEGLRTRCVCMCVCGCVRVCNTLFVNERICCHVCMTIDMLQQIFYPNFQLDCRWQIFNFPFRKKKHGFQYQKKK